MRLLVIEIRGCKVICFVSKGYQEGGALNNGGCFNLIEITANSTVCMMIQLILLLETAMIIVLFCRVQRGKMRCK